MKYIKRFNEEVVEEKSTEDWCKYYLESYIINDDGTVDVDDNIELSNKKFVKIPIQFGVVRGNFNCGHNFLNTLRGCPKIVNGNFWCYRNKLKNLIGGPKKVGYYYNCMHNNLISLEGIPEEVGLYFNCLGNPIYEIYKLFGNYKAYRDSLDYNYLRGDKIIKLRFKEALEEAGVLEIPESILYYKYI